MTSREQSDQTMSELIRGAKGDKTQVLTVVSQYLQNRLNEKRETVLWKLASIKRAFEQRVEPDLKAKRLME